MDFNSAVSTCGAVVAVVAAGVAVWQVKLMQRYRREDAEANETDRQQKARNLRTVLRAQFESVERQIPNVQGTPTSRVIYTALNAVQMEPVENIGQCLHQLDVLPEELQSAVRDAYGSLRKIGQPYTSVTPPPADFLKAKDAVAKVLSLL